MEVTIPLARLVGAQVIKTVVFIVVLLNLVETCQLLGTITLWLPQALSLMRTLHQVVLLPTPLPQPKASARKDGLSHLEPRLTANGMLLAFLQSWVGVITMALCTMRLQSGTGGGLLHIMVQGGTILVTMVVAYIPMPTTVTMGTMCGVSRLHKLIPVYSFYSYWRIRIISPVIS